MGSKVKEERLQPTRIQLIKMALAIRDTYLTFDREDYCEGGMKRCNRCIGCIQYTNLQRAWEIARQVLPLRLLP